MPDIDQRLIRCFRAVFPGLDEKKIPSVEIAEVPEWDSLASVTLLRVLEEEFGTRIDLLDFADMRGFQDVRRYLSTRTE